MTKGLLVLARKMTGNRTPVVPIPNIDLFKDSYKKIIQATAGALQSSFEDFLQTYEEYASEERFSLEDIIHNVVLSDIGNIAYVHGVDVVYDDRTYHIRFLIDGVDSKIARINYLSAYDYKSDINGTEVYIHYERIALQDKSECWEYTIGM